MTFLIYTLSMHSYVVITENFVRGRNESYPVDLVTLLFDPHLKIISSLDKFCSAELCIMTKLDSLRDLSEDFVP